MEIKQLTLEEMEKLHRTQMARDFPPDELRPFSSIYCLTKQGCYRSFGCFEEGRLCAYATFATPAGDDTALLLDYFAVDPSQRGKGTGTRFLNALREAFQGSPAPCILIEVESLETARTPEQLDERARRIRFYKDKCGCRESQVYSYLFGVEYRVLYLPLRLGALPADDSIQAALESVYRTIVTPLCGPSPEDFQRVCRCYRRAGRER